MAKSTLAGKSVLVSGGSRGIGLAIALRAARDGANVALLAKTAEPHPKLEGTVFTAAADIDAAPGADVLAGHPPTVACPLLRSPESSRTSTPPGCGAPAGDAVSS